MPHILLLAMENAIKKYSMNNGKWFFDDYKAVKVVANNSRILFQRKGNKYTRGLGISKDAFLKMEDVSIVPDMRIELEPEVWLTNYGKSIHMVKYCLTRDKKRCNGGFFTFTPKEWNYFWTSIRQKVINHFDK